MFGMPAPPAVSPLEPSGAIVNCVLGASGGPGLLSLPAWAGPANARVRPTAVASRVRTALRTGRGGAARRMVVAPISEMVPGSPVMATVRHQPGFENGQNAP